MSKNTPTDLDLLAMRAEGLVDRSIGIRFDHCATHDALGFGPAVPVHLKAALRATWDEVRHWGGPAATPVPLTTCERMLCAEGCSVRIGEGNLVYLLDPNASFVSDVTMHRSDRTTPPWLAQANPGNWEPIEWDELLRGALGPWVMATHEERVVSITHAPTPLTDHSVEAGAWTDPEFRGRGYASAVTAEWADVMRPYGRLLFYSTGHANLSSHRVAERLHMRRVGTQWLLHDRELEPDGGVHPLSELRVPSGPGGSTAPPGAIEPIETDRLRLESMSTDVLAALRDQDVPTAQRFANYRVPSDFSLLGKRAAVEHRLKLIAADRSQHPWMFRAVLRKSDGALLGYVSFHHKAPDPDLQHRGEVGVELAYGIEPAYRRRGYAKEAVLGMMQWALRESEVRSFILSIRPDNLPSLRTAESMGYRVIGQQEDPVDGTELVMKSELIP